MEMAGARNSDVPGHPFSNLGREGYILEPLEWKTLDTSDFQTCNDLVNIYSSQDWNSELLTLGGVSYHIISRITSLAQLP